MDGVDNDNDNDKRNELQENLVLLRHEILGYCLFLGRVQNLTICKTLHRFLCSRNKGTSCWSSCVRWHNLSNSFHDSYMRLGPVIRAIVCWRELDQIRLSVVSHVPNFRSMDRRASSLPALCTVVCAPPFALQLHRRITHHVYLLLESSAKPNIVCNRERSCLCQ